MSNIFDNILKYLDNGKNLNRIYLFLVVFLCIVKLPALITTDIQPWDEGMYAVRVLSIHLNGDFFDQTDHSVGGFYSASHPPLLIWIGYLFTLVFGVNSIVLKLTPFLFSLLSLYLIMLIGRKLFDGKTGFLAALIFSSSIIFNVFSKRFQFDIPYTFFILLSFYLIILYQENPHKKYIILSGISLGLCLMVKILVGFFIPIILFITFLVLRDRFKLKLMDLVLLVSIGIAIALPWHMYMMITYGQEFFHYFLGYHIIDRAFTGVEQNEKASGVFYHINYLFNIIPFGVIIFISLVNDVIKVKKLQWQKIFLWVWFLTGLTIITLFKTKLEVYILLLLAPGSFLIVRYIFELKKEDYLEKTGLFALIFFNIFWYFTEYYRNDVKSLITNSNPVIVLLILLVSIILAIFISRIIARKLNATFLLTGFILLFFISSNVYYLFRIPSWENTYNLSSVKETIDESGRKKIYYVGTNYRHNPQFSFYFDGLNIDWNNEKYDYEFYDTKDGLDNLKKNLESLDKGKYSIIVEKDNINRSEYPDSKLFIPENLKFAKKSPGYELYQN